MNINLDRLLQDARTAKGLNDKAGKKRHVPLGMNPETVIDLVEELQILGLRALAAERSRDDAWTVCDTAKRQAAEATSLENLSKTEHATTLIILGQARDALRRLQAELREAVADLHEKSRLQDQIVAIVQTTAAGLDPAGPQEDLRRILLGKIGDLLHPEAQGLAVAADVAGLQPAQAST